MIRKNKICEYCKEIFNKYTNGATKTCSVKCRFMNTINIDESGCWTWKRTGKKACRLFQNGDRQLTIKVSSWVLFRDATYNNNRRDDKYKNQGMLRNTCPNDNCVNPWHLIENSPDTFLINRKCTHCGDVITELNAFKKSNFRLKYSATCKLCKKLESKEWKNKKREQLYSTMICQGCGKNLMDNGLKMSGRCSTDCSFISKYTVNETTGCYNWSFSKTNTGYAKFYIPELEKIIIAQKYAYWRNNKEEYSLKELRESRYIFADTTCNNKICVNYDHIYIRRSRAGLSQSTTKITPEKEILLKQMYEKGNMSYLDLAKYFNCSKPVIGKRIKKLCFIPSEKKQELDSDESMEEMIGNINKALDS